MCWNQHSVPQNGQTGLLNGPLLYYVSIDTFLYVSVQIIDIGQWFSEVDLYWPVTKQRCSQKINADSALAHLGGLKTEFPKK